jgi:hypothetical protein
VLFLRYGEKHLERLRRDAAAVRDSAHGPAPAEGF